MKLAIATDLPYISLAATGGGYPEMMTEKGHKLQGLVIIKENMSRMFSM